MTIGLFLVALALAVAYGWFFRPIVEEARVRKESQERLFHLRGEDVQLVRIQRVQGTIEIARNGAGWTLAGRFPADKGAVEKIIDGLLSARIVKTIGPRDHAGEFGLDPPVMAVWLGSRSESEFLQIGNKNPAGDGNYAYPSVRGEVVLLDARVVKETDVDVFDLREKRVFPVELAEVMRVRIDRPDQALELQRSDRGWRMVAPWHGPIDIESVENFVSAITTQRVEEFFPWRDEFEEIGPVIRVAIMGDGPAERRVDLRYWGNEWNKGILVREDGSAEAARTRRDYWQLLHMDATRLMERRLFRFGSDAVVNVRIAGDAGTFNVARDGGSWHMNGTILSGSAVERLLAFLASWRAILLVPEGVLGDTGEKGTFFSVEVETLTGKETVRVLRENMDARVSPTALSAPSGTGSAERTKVDFWLSAATNLDYPCIVSSLDLRSLQELVGKVDHE